MKDYVRAARNYPWLFEAVERAIATMSGGASNDGQRMLRSIRTSAGRPIADSEALVALNALTDLGVVTRKGARYHFDTERWHDTEQIRRGVQEAIAVISNDAEITQAEASLCVSLPPTLSSSVEHIIRQTSADLRSGVLDVIAAAQQSLIIASPFWDEATSEEIARLAKKKLAAGVAVVILGRFSRDLPAPVRSQLRKVASHSSCSILSWFEGVGADTQTFHFKAISADRGMRAYLGSANMTESSLRSRMEIGVVLKGRVAEDLDRVLRVVMTLASKISL